MKKQDSHFYVSAPKATSDPTLAGVLIRAEVIEHSRDGVKPTGLYTHLVMSPAAAAEMVASLQAVLNGFPLSDLQYCDRAPEFSGCKGSSRRAGRRSRVIRRRSPAAMLGERRGSRCPDAGPREPGHPLKRSPCDMPVPMPTQQGRSPGALTAARSFAVFAPSHQRPSPARSRIQPSISAAGHLTADAASLIDWGNRSSFIQRYIVAWLRPVMTFTSFRRRSFVGGASMAGCV